MHHLLILLSTSYFHPDHHYLTLLSSQNEIGQMTCFATAQGDVNHLYVGTRDGSVVRVAFAPFSCLRYPPFTSLSTLKLNAADGSEVNTVVNIASEIRAGGEQ
jgi:hypothetical protein